MQLGLTTCTKASKLILTAVSPSGWDFQAGSSDKNELTRISWMLVPWRPWTSVKPLTRQGADSPPQSLGNAEPSRVMSAGRFEGGGVCAGIGICELAECQRPSSTGVSRPLTDGDRELTVVGLVSGVDTGRYLHQGAFHCDLRALHR